MNPTLDTDQNAMSDILSREIAASAQLLEGLTAERKSIIGADSTALVAAVHTKEQALELLNRLEQQRLALVDAAGYNPGPDGMAVYMQKAHNRGDLDGLWQQLLAQAIICRDQNRENYQLVEMYSHHTHQTLCILRGEDPGESVYGPAGISRGRHETRSLAKA